MKKEISRPTARSLLMEDKGIEVQYLKKVLHRFGYHQPCGCPENMLCEHAAESLGKYQIFFKLPVTKILDEATITQMRKPRCGVPDIFPGEKVLYIVSNFTLTGGKWNHTNITYFFQNGTGDIAGTTEWDIIRQALDRWAQVTPLTFTQVNNEAAADIRFLWTTGDHGDGIPFDGFGNVYAHAFPPPPVNSLPIAGDVHFDDAEKWDTSDGGFWLWKHIDLFTVAIHEIGHALGLGHSSVEDSVMWPSYEGERRALHPDDIEAIQELYGPPVAHTENLFAEASLWGLHSTSGYGSVTIDLGRPRRFVAWGSITMIDSLSDFDRDNAVAVEVFKVDGNVTWKALYGGDHFGALGASSNVHQGAFVGFGRRITFRIRSFHHSDFEAYGMGTVIALD